MKGVTEPTDGQVDVVRFLRSHRFDEEEIAELAKLTVVEVRAVSDVDLEHQEADLDDGGGPRRKAGRPSALTPEQVQQAVTMRSADLSYRRIAAVLGCSRETVRTALQRVDVPEPEPRDEPPPAQSTSWPPAPNEATRWHDVPLLGGRCATVRPVLLWGATVYVDRSGKVWCDGCLEMLEPSVLQRPDSPHRLPNPMRGRGPFSFDAGEERFAPPESELDRLWRAEQPW